MAFNNNMQKKCGFCGESIPANAGRCPYCGSILEVSFDNNYNTKIEDVKLDDEYRINPGQGENQAPYNPEQPTRGQADNSDPFSTDKVNQGNADNQASGASGQGEPSQPVQYQNPQQNNQYQQNPSNTNPYQDFHAQYTEPKQQLSYQSRIQNSAGQQYESGYGYRNDNRYSNETRNPLSNGMKVFLTVLFTLIPGIGQLAGIITAIIFMNTEGDSDRKSFGVAILVASLIMFVLSCIGCFVAAIAFSANQYSF